MAFHFGFLMFCLVGSPIRSFLHTAPERPQNRIVRLEENDFGNVAHTVLLQRTNGGVTGNQRRQLPPQSPFGRSFVQEPLFHSLLEGGGLEKKPEAGYYSPGDLPRASATSFLNAAASLVFFCFSSA